MLHTYFIQRSKSCVSNKYPVYNKLLRPTLIYKVCFDVLRINFLCYKQAFDSTDHSQANKYKANSDIAYGMQVFYLMDE